MRGVVAREDILARAQLRFAERVERGVDRFQKLMQIAVILFDEQKPGDDLAGGVALLQVSHRRDPVVRVVVGRELAQPQYRAVVLDDGLDRAGRLTGCARLGDR